MEDIFQSEMVTNDPPKSDIRIFFREIIRDELRRQERKQKKKNDPKKSKKKKKKAKKSSEWEKMVIKSVQIAIENGIPALFRKWESNSQEKMSRGGK